MKRQALAGIVLLSLSGCALTDWAQKRSGCGLKCPANSSCEVVSSGVFTASYGCVCDHGLTHDGFMHPSKKDPCPAPTPSP